MLELETPKWKLVTTTKRQQKAFAIDLGQKLNEWHKKNWNDKERIWDLKQHIRVMTFGTQKTQPWSGHVPPHVFKVSPPPEAKQLLPKVTEAMHDLFGHLLNINSDLDKFMHCKQDFIQAYQENKFIVWPTNSTHDYEEHGKAIAMQDLRDFLQSTKYKVIDDFLSIYLNMIVSDLATRIGKTEDDIMQYFRDKGTLYLLKYVPSGGIKMHIDNLLRSDATVHTIGFGRDVVYDMVQVIPETNGYKMPMLRCTNEEGTMMIIDGKSRYMYGHAIPYAGRHSKSEEQRNFERCKYTIIIRLFHHGEITTNVGYCKELQTYMYSMH
jgi:hypothetical protein